MRKWAGYVLIVGGILLFAQSLGGGILGRWWVGSQEVQGVPLAGMDVVEIHAAHANIEVMKHDRPELRAVLEGSRSAHLEADRDDRSVRVRAESGWFDWFFWRDDLTLRIYVPHDYQRNLAIDLSAGNVSVAGRPGDPMRLRDLEIDLSAGNVDLEQVNLRHLSYDVSAGNLRTDEMTSERTEVDLSTGNVRLEQFAGSLDANVSVGEIDVEWTSLTGPVKATVSSGSIKLDLPETADFTLDAHASNGDVDVSIPLQGQSGHRNQVSGTYGAGTHRVQAEVSNGRIDIR